MTYCKSLFLVMLLGVNLSRVYAQEVTKQPADTLSKFDQFNKKAEALFKVMPVPLISYSTDAGNVFGLAKFNTFQASKKDTISSPLRSQR